MAQGNFTISGPDSHYTYFRRATITSSASGALDTTVDWTYPTNSLWMYVAEGDCTADQFARDECPGATCPCRFSVTSEADSPKPRVLTVPSASAGTRTLIVWNLGPREEACSYQAILTTTAAAAAALNARSSAAGEPGGEMGVKRAPEHLPDR